MKIFQFTKTVSSNAVPEALGAGLDFDNIQFIGQRSFGSDNAGNVTIQIKDCNTLTFTDAFVIAPGEVYNWPFSSRVDASEFKVKVATNNDGVRCICTKTA